jgi:ketosteroid isomerase-like protein
VSVARLISYHAALNDFDLEAVEGMFAVDAEYVSPGLNGAIQGRDAIMKAMREYFAEYSDQRAEDDEVVALAANVVQSHWRLRATASKTGKVLERRGQEVVTFNAAGLIARVEVFDAE